VRLTNRLCVLLLLLALSAAPAWALTVAGRVVDGQGRPVAGALVSDGAGIVASGPDGAFSLASAPGRVVALTAPPGLAAPGRWWWPAAQAARLGVVRLAAAPPLPRDRLRLGIVSDPHLYAAGTAPSWAGKLDPARPLRVWRKAAERLREYRPHLVLVCGDLAMDADQGGEARARAQLELAARAMALLPAPWRAVPGNHDARYRGGRVDLSLWRRSMGPARGVFRLGPLAVILLDNLGASTQINGKPRSCGRLPRQALAWLAAALKLLPPETPLLVVSHYPLASPLAGANPLRQRSLVKAPGGSGLALRDVDQNAALALALLRSRPLAGLVSGHQHAFFTASLAAMGGAVNLVGAPALCGRWWQGPMPFGPLSFAPGLLEGRLLRRGRAWRLEVELVDFPPAAGR